MLSQTHQEQVFASYKKDLKENREEKCREKEVQGVGEGDKKELR